MEKEYNSKIQQQLESYIAQVGSQAKAAQAIGYSTAVLSTYRKGDYKGNIEDVEKKFAEFFQLRDEKQAASEKAEPFGPVQDEYIPTSISSDVYQSIRYCQLRKCIGVLHGDAGVGKTKAAKQYALENSGTAIYLEATPITGTLPAFMRLLANSLRLSTFGRIDKIFEAICERLNGTNKVLIIDEAQFLGFRALEQIRNMPENLNIAIVLLGNDEIHDRMCGRKQASFAQQFTRTAYERHYITRQILREDVDKLFPALGNSNMGKELDFIYGICQSKYSIRSAINVYNNAINNENINFDGLLLAARKLGIGIV